MAQSKSPLREFNPAKAVKLASAYSEDNDDFVPDPTHQFGTVDTSGTAGIADSRIEEVTPIFDVAKAQDAVAAARALDPDDPDVPEMLVNLPTGVTIVQGDPEAAREAVQAKGEAAAAEPVEVGGPSLAQRKAAEGDSPKSKAAARPSGGTTSTS